MNNIHADHRSRLRKRFLEHGLDSFSDHEILELLLFYSRPRVNTNPIAHALLKRFGTLSGVFEAEYADLLGVDGVGESSANLIRMMVPVFKRYASDKKVSQKTFTSGDDIGRFLLNHYIGESREKVTLLLFDAKCRMTDVITLHNGSVNTSDVDPNKVAELVFSRRASSFVIAHNHPGGNLTASSEDKQMTYDIFSAFSKFKVLFREHYLIAGGEYIPILDLSLAEFDK